MSRNYLISSLILSVIACNGANGDTFLIDADEFKAMMGEDSILIDVRTPQEYNAGYIKGAVNIDFHAPDFQAQLDELDRDSTYLIYCQSGYRSKIACRMMNDLEFTSVYDLRGGFSRNHQRFEVILNDSE